jgi:tetratricopeptide (TPR) repeat protein
MIAKDTTDYYLRYQIAGIYESMGKHNKAIKEYKKLLKRDPNYTHAYIKLGVIYYKNFNDYKSAKKYLEKAYELEMSYYGSTYYTDIPYYLGLIAVKERKKFIAMIFYFELKNIYTYSTEDNNKKIELLKALKSIQ